MFSAAQDSSNDHMDSSVRPAKRQRQVEVASTIEDEMEPVPRLSLATPQFSTTKNETRNSVQTPSHPSINKEEDEEVNDDLYDATPAPSSRRVATPSPVSHIDLTDLESSPEPESQSKRQHCFRASSASRSQSAVDIKPKIKTEDVDLDARLDTPVRMEGGVQHARSSVDFDEIKRA